MKIEVDFLRLRPRNFAIIPESLAANLEKVRQTTVWQTVPKFWFIWLWYLSYKSMNFRGRTQWGVLYLLVGYRIMIKNFESYRVDCPGGVRRNIFAKDTKHLSTLFMKRKHERNKHFQFSTGLYLQVLATRESNNNFRTNLVDRKESFAYIH